MIKRWKIQLHSEHPFIKMIVVFEQDIDLITKI